MLNRKRNWTAYSEIDIRLESVFGTTEIPEIIFACGPPDDVTAVEKKYPETFSKLTVRWGDEV